MDTNLRVIFCLFFCLAFPVKGVCPDCYNDYNPQYCISASLVINVYVNPSTFGSDTGAYNKAVAATGDAIKKWMNARGSDGTSKLPYTLQTTTDEASANVIVSNDPNKDAVGDNVAVTNQIEPLEPGKIYLAPENTQTGYMNPDGTTIDKEQVAATIAHELGHAMGIDDAGEILNTLPLAVHSNRKLILRRLSVAFQREHGRDGIGRTGR